MPTDFLTAGGGASDALDQILARKRAEAQQALVNQIAQQNQQLAVQRENRADDLQRQQAKDLEFNREDLRASRSFENALPGEVDPLTAELWRKHGYGSAIENKVIPGQIQPQGETPDTRDPSRNALWIEGGSKFQMAREAAKERSAQAEAAAVQRAQDKQDQFDQNAQLRRDLQENTIKAENDRAAAALQIRKDAEEEKKAEKEKAEQNRITGVKNDTAGTLDILNQLIDDKGNLQPGVGPVVGSTEYINRAPDWWLNNVSGGDKLRKIEQLKSRLTLGLIDQIKAMSPTGSIGFRLTNQDVQILQNAAANLDRRQSEAQFAQQLQSTRDILKKVLQNPTGATFDQPKTFDYDANGNLVTSK